MHKPKTLEIQTKEPFFPIVGIGASAGGLDAFKQFLQAIPEKSGMAYVLVQHMNPKYESRLAEILSKTTHLPVVEIEDNCFFRADHIYIMPSGKLLIASDGMLTLADVTEKNKHIKTIDLFFSSLGVVHQNFAVGVVLSGNATDGTLGLKVIKANGGLTFAQDDTAAFEGMPHNAITSGVVDFVLPPGEIPGKLIEINRPFQTAETEEKVTDTDEKQAQEIYKQILLALNLRKGTDFTYYKQATIKRRIARRMALKKIQQPKEYLDFLRENKTEQEALYDDMLIGVTNFFRDINSFETICKELVPLILKQKKDVESVRIWVAGCSTGEEAYSIAICLNEAIDIKSARLKLQIFATDISEKAITKARTGIYTQNELEGVSDFRLQQFFTKADGSYHINKSIREICVFAHHNFLKDPPFAKMDIISCRNVLIYMEPILQKRVFNTFHYALKDKGFLILGKSESAGTNSDLFDQFVKNQKIYLKKQSSRKFMAVVSERSETVFKKEDKKDIPPDMVVADFQTSADRLVLLKYAPAGVVVNEQLDILQFRGEIGNYLEPAPGKASLNLLKMAKGSLGFELRNLLYKTKKTGSAEKKVGLPVSVNGTQQLVTIDAIPLPDTLETNYLILFRQQDLVTEYKEQPLVRKNRFTRSLADKDLRIEQLEKELAQARDDMRSITEEQEAANEELQSANEELLSGGEELQTLNEELETSQEELQSTNEELLIINHELLDRNEQLIAARNYNDSIIETIRDPLIILDKNLFVKSATNGFYKKFKLFEKDTEGKLLFEVGNNQWDIPALRHLLENIIPEKSSFSDYEIVYSFPNVGQRNIMLNAKRIEKVNNEQYILLAIEDITERRIVEKGLAEIKNLYRESQERLKLAIESTGIGTWDFYPSTNEWIMDDQCRQLYNVHPDQPSTYETFLNIVHTEDRALTHEVIQKTLKGYNHGNYDIEFRTAAAEKYASKWIRAKGKTFFNEEGDGIRFIGISLDITQQKTILDELETRVQERTRSLAEAIDALAHSNENLEQFAYVASHDLQEPLRKIETFALMLQQKEKENLGDDTKKYLDRISIAATRMKKLITDILDFSRVSSPGKSFEPTDLNHILKNVLTDFELLINQKQAVVNAVKLPVLNAMPAQLNQLFHNLISNALKFSNENVVPVINITCKVSDIAEKEKYSLDNKEKYYHLIFSDNGIGFDQKYADRVFLIFQRLVGKSEYEGTGIGLAICQKIVLNHRGVIVANSKESEGTSFHIFLPAALERNRA